MSTPILGRLQNRPDVLHPSLRIRVRLERPNLFRPAAAGTNPDSATGSLDRNIAACSRRHLQSHFFILVKESPPLDGKFAAFGRVTKGMEVVDAINKAPVTEEKPEKPVRIKKATVFACPAPST